MKAFTYYLPWLCLDCAENNKQSGHAFYVIFHVDHPVMIVLIREKWSVFLPYDAELDK